MPGKDKNPASKKRRSQIQNKWFYEGESLSHLVQSTQSAIISTRHVDGSYLPEKIWLKQQFCIGVNDVTRVLERMAPCSELGNLTQLSKVNGRNPKAPSVKLQVILVASDCNPRSLTKHLPSLASSRSVPLIFVKDNKWGSLRLGEIVKLKSAVAIGVKAKANGINKLFEKILLKNEIDLVPDRQNTWIQTTLNAVQTESCVREVKCNEGIFDMSDGCTSHS